MALAAICVPAPAQQPAKPTASSAAAARELDAFSGALAGITGYGATVAIFDRKDAQIQNVVFDYSFSKPSNVTLHVTAGPNAGVTLDWSGGSTVVAHRGSGIAALFKKTLSLHDPQVTTLGGSSIDQLSFAAILAHVAQQPGKVVEAPGEAIDGVAVNAVTLIPAAPAADAGLTREVLVLSAATHLPMRLLGYQGSTLVRKIDLSNIKLRRV
ncbi:MAG: hypothetical protein ABI231_08695 [Candidatus Tumulicola sp.]